LSYLLDTNACIGILNGTAPGLVARMRSEDPGAIKLSSVVRAELLFGARKSSRVEQNLTLLSKFFAPFESLAFDDRAAEHYGLIRAELEREGRLIGPNDLLIAATARTHDATLVTRNTKEFSRVVGLRIENWEGEEQGP
jgi:tRNA(fMet)-specific endonuclease VapC